MKFADCTVETAEMAPETVSTEALSRLKDLRNVTCNVLSRITHVKQGLEHSNSQFSPCELAASAHHSHCQKPCLETPSDVKTQN